LLVLYSVYRTPSKPKHESGKMSDSILELVNNPLASQIYELLWQKIVTGELKAGEKLSDLRLSDQLGVSRTPVREALYRLAQDGIVQARANHGFFVATFSVKDATELYDVRTALEVLAVRLAFPNLNSLLLTDASQELEVICQRLAAGDPTAKADYLPIDQAFHRLIYASANNKRLETLLNGLLAQIGVFQVYGLHSEKLLNISIEQHRAILDALIHRDLPAAEHAMEKHIQGVKRHIIAELTDN
jgi:GntR family transcriptional regulator, rspAB operon transcriptional repressor